MREIRVSAAIGYVFLKIHLPGDTRPQALTDETVIYYFFYTGL